MANRVLVTGSSGFLGRALVPALVAAGYWVGAAARTPSRDANESLQLPDITQPVDWAPLVAGWDKVVHLAAIAHRPSAEKIDYAQANTAAAADLAGACLKTGVQQLIFLSSIGAQTTGASNHVLTEAEEPNPGADYGHAKLAAEEAIRASGIAHTILRPTIVFGPRPVANVAQLVKLARLPMPLPFGGFTNRRSMLAIDNLISAILFALSAPAALDQTFIVTNPDALSLRDTFATLRRAQGRSPQLVNVPPALLKTALMAIGKGALWEKFGTDLVASPQKLIDAGWRPVVTTEQGLTAMMRAEDARRG